MGDERTKVISEINKEIEEISNVVVIRLILSVVRSYKKGGAA